jgi:ubiquinone/menaquinone biosynthesis C-methylase UbiE
MDSPLDDKIQDYYNQGKEQDRLLNAGGQLERARTQEIVQRYLPKPPAKIDDIGGGAGIYALWLASLGYEVHLVDGMPLHVEQALKASEKQPEHRLASAEVGDARHLDFDDESADAVLLFGPLYHLTERADRIQAIREAGRILKPGGWLFTAAISRFAPFTEGIIRGFLFDPYFSAIVEQDLKDGQHRNPEKRPNYFSTAYFHHPSEIGAELSEAGFEVETVLPVEGLGAIMLNIDDIWDDRQKREWFLSLIRATENDPTLLGATGHLIGVGRKPLELM